VYMNGKIPGTVLENFDGLIEQAEAEAQHKADKQKKKDKQQQQPEAEPEAEPSPQTKLWSYHGHREAILGVALYFGAPAESLPPASSLFFELHQEQSLSPEWERIEKRLPDWVHVPHSPSQPQKQEQEQGQGLAKPRYLVRSYIWRPCAVGSQPESPSCTWEQVTLTRCGYQQDCPYEDFKKIVRELEHKAGNWSSICSWHAPQSQQQQQPAGKQPGLAVSEKLQQAEEAVEQLASDSLAVAAASHHAPAAAAHGHSGRYTAADWFSLPMALVTAVLVLLAGVAVKRCFNSAMHKAEPPLRDVSGGALETKATGRKADERTPLVDRKA